jgi:hypothetical protein
MILKPKRIQGLVAAPGTGKTINLITAPGPGVFVAAHVTKQGGTNNICQVALYIDGANVVAVTYAAADNIGLDEQNNSGVKLVNGLVKCISIQYNEPLYFTKECRIEIKTGTDSGIAQIVANAVIGSNCQYPA